MQFKTTYNDAKSYQPKINQKKRPVSALKTERPFITSSMSNELLMIKNRDILTGEMKKIDVIDEKSQLGRIRKN